MQCWENLLYSPIPITVNSSTAGVVTFHTFSCMGKLFTHNPKWYLFSAKHPKQRTCDRFSSQTGLTAWGRASNGRDSSLQFSHHTSAASCLNTQGWRTDCWEGLQLKWASYTPPQIHTSTDPCHFNLSRSTGRIVHFCVYVCVYVCACGLVCACVYDMFSHSNVFLKITSQRALVSGCSVPQLNQAQTNKRNKQRHAAGSNSSAPTDTFHTASQLSEDNHRVWQQQSHAKAGGKTEHLHQKQRFWLSAQDWILENHNFSVAKQSEGWRWQHWWEVTYFHRFLTYMLLNQCMQHTAQSSE